MDSWALAQKIWRRKYAFIFASIEIELILIYQITAIKAEAQQPAC
jgi:hypothetical protein